MDNAADTLLEYIEKLVEKGIPDDQIEQPGWGLMRLGQDVPILFYHFSHYPKDPDDIAFFYRIVDFLKICLFCRFFLRCQSQSSGL